MRVRVGTSGFAYKEWKGPFYPEQLQDSAMLAYYAERLRAVEINNTFYRMPSEKLLAGWAERVPEGFSFVLKAPRRITHRQRLRDCADSVDHLLRASSVLGEKLGPILFQLPPYLRKDARRLRDFLELLPEGRGAALEFRHPSWLDEEIYALLASRDVALVAADTDDEREVRIVPTARHGYLRLRRADYDGAALERWAGRVAAQPWRETFVFFKHEEAGAGPRLARRFQELVDRG